MAEATTTARPLVLASSSPAAGCSWAASAFPFGIRLSLFDESSVPATDPVAYVRTLAREKAERVAWEARDDTEASATGPSPLILGADTAVAIDGDILGKPADAADAERMLRRLRDRAHIVLTGLALVDVGTGAVTTSVAETTVRMRAFADDALAAYVATGEPLDKAGGYAIQGRSGELIEGFDGCYANVVGLPLCEVAAMLRATGLSIPAPDPVCVLPDGAPCPRLGLVGAPPDR